MCTIIAISNPNPDYRVIFLENRDKPIEKFSGNQFRLLEENMVASIFDTRSNGISCGYSIKTGLYAGVTNIHGYQGEKSRGILLKNVLTGKSSLEDALLFMQNELRSGLYSAGCYLLGMGENMFVLENFGSELEVYGCGPRVVITNRLSRLRCPSQVEYSRRAEFVEEVFRKKRESSLDEVISIAGHHGNKDSVCRHKTTVASFIVAEPRDEVGPKILYSLGEPCHGYDDVSRLSNLDSLDADESIFTSFPLQR